MYGSDDQTRRFPNQENYEWLNIIPSYETAKNYNLIDMGERKIGYME